MTIRRLFLIEDVNEILSGLGFLKLRVGVEKVEPRGVYFHLKRTVYAKSLDREGAHQKTAWMECGLAEVQGLARCGGMARMI